MGIKESILNYIEAWENRCYKQGIPDEAPRRLEVLNKVPSYRMIVMAILKNDVCLKSLGESPRKCKSYHELKKN